MAYNADRLLAYLTCFPRRGTQLGPIDTFLRMADVPIPAGCCAIRRAAHVSYFNYGGAVRGHFRVGAYRWRYLKYIKEVRGWGRLSSIFGDWGLPAWPTVWPEGDIAN